MIGMQVGGVTPLTSIDFPGELAAVVFCQGCPWRCRYCQNGHLLPRSLDGEIDWLDVRAFLTRRRGLLDAVVFSGGEPLLQRALPGAVAECRDMGFKVGLHTAGCYPERLDELLPMLDWAGLDIKALPEDYPALTGVPGSGVRAFESLACLVESGLDHEVRITVHSELLPPDRLERLLAMIDRYGAGHVMLQRCHSERALDASLVDDRASWSWNERFPATAWRERRRQVSG